MNPPFGIMQNMQNNQNIMNMQNMQNNQNMMNMQNMQNNQNIMNMYNMQNNQNMMNMQIMQNISNVPNQFMNMNDPNITELVKPYLEKIKKLEEEIREKVLENSQLKFKLNQMAKQINQMNMMKNMENQMNMMMNPMNAMNNQFNLNMMNIPNNPINNNIINNPMFQMCNQMNLNQNMMMPMMRMANGNQNTSNKIKNFSICVRMGNTPILIQCQSKDTMESLIDKFCCKAVVKKEDYTYIIVKKSKKARMDLTVEENGIIDGDETVFVTKKTSNDNNEDNNIEKENVEQLVNIKRKNIENIIILGEIINLNFDYKNKQYIIQIGMNNFFYDAVCQFCQRLGIPNESIFKGIVFLCNGKKINVTDKKTLQQIGINNGETIIVNDTTNLIGA